MLKTVFAAQAKRSVRPDCTAATILFRKCWDMREKLVVLNLSLPYIPPPAEQTWAKNVGGMTVSDSNGRLAGTNGVTALLRLSCPRDPSGVP